MSDAMQTTAMQNPKVLSGIAPYLMLENAGEAAKFYQRAFGAQEVARHPGQDGVRFMHIHLYINGASLMLTDPWPEHGHPAERPQAFTLHLQVDDVDSWWKRAVDAGCEIVMPLEQQFWGDRYGQVRDPFGVNWSIAQSAA
jgi:PhnB protein